LSKYFFIALFIIFFLFNLFSDEKEIRFVFAEIKLNNLTDNNKQKNKFSDITYFNSLETYLSFAERYELKKEENPFRRAEILFFGSLTIISFASWISFSIYNTLMYNDSFGNLRRDQFIVIYLGAGIISFSVSITDLLIRLKIKSKGIEFY